MNFGRNLWRRRQDAQKEQDMPESTAPHPALLSREPTEDLILAPQMLTFEDIRDWTSVQKQEAIDQAHALRDQEGLTDLQGPAISIRAWRLEIAAGKDDPATRAVTLAQFGSAFECREHVPPPPDPATPEQVILRPDFAPFVVREEAQGSTRYLTYADIQDWSLDDQFEIILHAHNVSAGEDELGNRLSGKKEPRIDRSVQKRLRASLGVFLTPRLLGDASYHNVFWEFVIASFDPPQSDCIP